MCKLNNLKRVNITQFDLKQKVGGVICEYASSNSMKSDPVNGKRCWTLQYVDESNFHIDILPALPVSFDDKDNFICITDKRNPNYRIISTDWETSNPKGYYEWFRVQSNYYTYKKRFAQSSNSNIENIPYYKVKTPLQRIVQILKRHAEVMFEDEMEFKPSSIIITTLAAHAYPEATHDDSDFISLIMRIIKNLKYGIEYDMNNPCVYNPANKEEKLSTKWDKNNQYFAKFLLWIEQLKADFNIDQEISILERMSYIEQSLKINSSNNISESLSSLPHHQAPKWKNLSIVDVRIKASESTTKNGKYSEIQNGGLLGKNRHLKFEVIANNIDNFEIYWQITNTGYEARNSMCLRGDFYESELLEGKKIRTEQTSYIGKHYVEAYIIKDNSCYGKSEPFVVNIVKGMIGYKK